MQNPRQGNSANVSPQGYILCGGKSRRFGEDKARFEIEGEPMISRITRWLENWTDSITAIADVPDKYQDLHLNTISDLHPGMGPLGGLQTALVHAKATSSCRWIVLVSCDMTRLPTNWLNTLWEQAKNSPQYDAVLFKEPSHSRFHPFPGCFHVDLLGVVEKQIAARELSLQKMFQLAGERISAMKLPEDWPDIPQINTKNDAARWKANHS